MEKSIFTRDYDVFLRQLRAEREKARLTQAELAERLNQTQSFISKCERGERRIDVVELRAFCHAIGISYTEFVIRFERALTGKHAIDYGEKL
ncbi:MAG: helix-turn-helix transcriptional regulator [Desulfobacteraceae bacterium]|nr:helix-turn-helix transcriptional regulator [Desulfobacteraceae bacterium]